MNDEVTIRTNWAQIIHWIDSIGFADFVKGLQVMHMNDISTNFAIHFFEIKTTNNTFRSIMLNAAFSGKTISFIAIYIYLLFCTLI